jgi:hypothetical protein
MLPTNTGMKRVSEKMGFTFSFEEGLLRARLDLAAAPAPDLVAAAGR